MYEEFREQAEDSFLDEDEEYEDEDRRLPIDLSKLKSVLSSMTPAQRFIILALLFVVVCLASALCLLVTGAVAPPFL
jgi:hypothetical protein